jgi:hypothetical protein
MEYRHYNASIHPGTTCIRKARLDAGLTLAKVAGVLGKHRSWLCRKELGWRRVRGAEVEAILKAISRLLAVS